MSALPWLVGGGALAAYLYSRSQKTVPAKPAPQSVPANPPTSTAPRVHAPTPSTTAPSSQSPATTTMTAPGPQQPLPGRWVWPVAKWSGRKSVVSSGIGSPRKNGPHQGVDIMFKRASGDPFPPRTPNGSKWFVMPDNVVVLAAGDGVIWSAGPTSGGHAVVIDHGPLKVATFYGHLEKLFVTPTNRAQSKQRVKAGDPIGTVGFDPRDGEKLRHLHFEIWRGGPKDWVDPEPLMQTWEAIDDPRKTNLVARNAGFVYRPIGASGEPYPEWVRALDGKAGVYVIRDRADHEILYVGSSLGRLYDTMTRHFQTWRRWKGYWKGQYGEGHDPGLTYPRDRVEVAARITSPADALDEEARLIRRLRPRDNLIGQPIEDEVPF